MKTDAALERAERRIELDAEAAIDLDLTLVVDPRHAENDLPLRFADALDQRVLCVVRMLGDDGSEAVEHFAYGLVEFFFAWIAA